MPRNRLCPSTSSPSNALDFPERHLPSISFRESTPSSSRLSFRTRFQAIHYNSISVLKQRLRTLIFWRRGRRFLFGTNNVVTPSLERPRRSHDKDALCADSSTFEKPQTLLIKRTQTCQLPSPGHLTLSPQRSPCPVAISSCPDSWLQRALKPLVAPCQLNLKRSFTVVPREFCNLYELLQRTLSLRNNLTVDYGRLIGREQQLGPCKVPVRSS